MHGIWVAGLLHAVHWEISETEVEISSGIRLVSTEESPIAELYKQACHQTGIDDGEPFDFNAYILIDPNAADPLILDFGDPYSLLDRVCNTLAIVTAQPVAMCRIFWSLNAFKTFNDTRLIYTYGAQTDFLVDDYASLNDINKAEIIKAWQTSLLFWGRDKSQGRLINALTYFYYAWRSHYLEQACLNLAIVIEILFAPHSQSETSHQISFNVSRFLGKSPDERERVYKLIRKFYNVRSSIVHGGIPDNDDVVDFTVEVFRLCASILKLILVDQNLAATFEDNKLRKELLSKFIFE